MKLNNFFLSLCILGITFAVTGQFLFLHDIPITPNNDLARHAAIAENFFAALHSWQILPRLQELFPPVLDIPLFQYYGFMNGLVALPSMLLGISSFKSLIIGVLFFRIAAATGIYWAGKLLGGNRGISLLAALIYFMTPYIISTFYGRVAIPETLAHCELPFLVLGLLFGLHGFRMRGIIVIAVTLLLLSLTHPIFLLYGCIALALMIAVSFSKNIIMTGIVGLTIGILLSTFQWYPAMISQSLLPSALSSTSSYSYIEGTRIFTSLQGLFNFPVSVASEVIPPATSNMELYLLDTKHLYLTPGWFTLPVLIGLIIQLRYRKKWVEKLIILIPGLIFLCLSFDIFGIFQFLPHITWAVQFPYRLLAFVALFTALALPILLPRLAVFGCIILALLVIIQSSALIFKPTHHTPLPITSSAIASSYGSTNYRIIDKKQPVLEMDGDGWIKNPSLIKHFTHHKPAVLWLTGFSIFSDRTIEMWLADPAKPKVPLTDKIKIPPGLSTVKLPLPDKPGDYILISSEVLIPAQKNPLGDARPLSFNVQTAVIIPSGTPFFPQISERMVQRKKISPYSRQFQVKQEAWWTKEGKTTHSGNVQLPIAYSPFFTFTQNKHLLTVHPDLQGLAIITTNDLTQPIKAQYRLPLLCYIAPLIGLILLFGLAIRR